MNIAGIIPARYSSSRFPGKPLALIQGKSMIQRVYEQALQAETLSEIFVATDDERIFSHAHGFCKNVVMTSASHRNGTERCFEALNFQKNNFDAIINIQGDEPLISPKQIDTVGVFLKTGAEIVTLAKRIFSEEDYVNPNVVKVVFNKKNEALYFSRSPIPFFSKDNIKNFSKEKIFKHIGIYGFAVPVLKAILKLPESNLEKIESLEQLRWLDNGYKIIVGETEEENFSVDTPEDLEKINKILTD